MPIRVLLELLSRSSSYETIWKVRFFRHFPKSPEPYSVVISYRLETPVWCHSWILKGWLPGQPSMKCLLYLCFLEVHLQCFDSSLLCFLGLVLFWILVGSNFGSVANMKSNKRSYTIIMLCRLDKDPFGLQPSTDEWCLLSDGLWVPLVLLQLIQLLTWMHLKLHSSIKICSHGSVGQLT